MTPDDITIARALSNSRLVRHSVRRGTIRMLHGETYKDEPMITDNQARMLRACVKTFASVLPADLVQLAGGAS